MKNYGKKRIEMEKFSIENLKYPKNSNMKNKKKTQNHEN